MMTVLTEDRKKDHWAVIRNLLKTLPLILAMGLTGCATMIRGTTQEIELTSSPTGALATTSDGQTCKTPCRLEVQRGQQLKVKYTKAGCQAQRELAFPTSSWIGTGMGGYFDYKNGAVYDLKPNPLHAVLTCR